jgi:hypothetical protein
MVQEDRVCRVVAATIRGFREQEDAQKPQRRDTIAGHQQGIGRASNRPVIQERPWYCRPSTSVIKSSAPAKLLLRGSCPYSQSLPEPRTEILPDHVSMTGLPVVGSITSPATSRSSVLSDGVAPTVST